jgi:ABC-type antimicrobial peptide transport system permease subunit
MNTQLNFLFHKDLGYDTSNLLRVDLPYGKENDKLMQLFREQLSTQADIIDISGRNRGTYITAVKAEGKNIEIDYNKIDYQYLPTFHIPLVAGRNFSESFPGDVNHSAIVNESFVKESGWGNPIGKTVNFMDGNRALTIVGVIKDYHYRSLREEIKPQLFSMDTSIDYGQLWVKIKQDRTPNALKAVQQVFHRLAPFAAYSYQFMDDQNRANYEFESRFKKMITTASILFIFISCIGLFGLVLLSIEQRTKEIGIRKVMGAAVTSIIFLIIREFFKLILIAFLIAIPLSYLSIVKWLQDFAYRINISWWMFAGSCLMVLLLSWITISVQAIRAAVANPVKSLRSE